VIFRRLPPPDPATSAPASEEPVAAVPSSHQPSWFWAKITGSAAATNRYSWEQVNEGDTATFDSTGMSDAFVGSGGTAAEAGCAYEINGRQDVPTGTRVKLSPAGDLTYYTFDWHPNGDVVGPTGATDGSDALFDGATGKLIKQGPTTTVQTTVNGDPQTTVTQYAYPGADPTTTPTRITQFTVDNDGLGTPRVTQTTYPNGTSGTTYTTETWTPTQHVVSNTIGGVAGSETAASSGGAIVITAANVSLAGYAIPASLLTGTVTIPQGGTATTAYAATPLVLSGTGTGAAFAQLTPGTSGQVLTSSGAGLAPTWSASTVAVGGVTGLGAGVATFLATPSSANLAAALTDESGSGAVAFTASPAFTGTPTAPTAGAGTNTTQIATTAFVHSEVATAVTGLLHYQGATDCSATPNYPAAVKGDAYIVSVAGRIGGAGGTQVDVGDWYIAAADNAGGTEASVGTSWAHLEHNLVGALLASNNLSDLASAATARGNLGLGTGNSPQFTALELGHASDTTLARSGAGDMTIEGNAVYRAGGTDVPVPDGGTGASTFTSHGVLLGQGASPLAATAAMSDGQLLVGQTSADPLPKSVTGDVTISAAGVTAIGASKVTNAMLAGSIDLAAKVTGLLPVASVPALNGFTDADWALDDRLPFYDTSATANRDGQTAYLLGLHRIDPGGRLTLTSGSPVSSEVSGATTIYYCPSAHDIIVLWDGTRWVPIQFVETSAALGTLTSGKPYDVFGYLSGGVLALEFLVWTNDTTRATAVTLQDGRWCKSGDKTRLLLGTFYTTSTTTTEDSATKRYVGNVYNREPRWLFTCPAYSDNNATTTWSATGTSVTEANAGTGSRVGAVFPLANNVLSVASAWNVTTPAANAGRVGLSIGQVASFDVVASLTANTAFPAVALTDASRVGAGLTFAAMLYQVGGGTMTVNADLGRIGGSSFDAYATFMTGTVLL
jgi:hypothetical protein